MYITIIFKHFFSETAWPINAKFHEEPPWELGKKVYIHVNGHMTKMAAMSLNRLASQCQISCGAFLGTENKILYKWSRSHDQDDRHAHIW